jgi:hypothetical protein
MFGRVSGDGIISKVIGKNSKWLIIDGNIN